MNKTILLGIAVLLMLSCGEEDPENDLGPGNQPTGDKKNYTSDVVVFQDVLENTEIVLAGNAKDLFIVSFERKLNNDLLEFSSSDEGLPVIMRDNEGNLWDIFGFAVSGPRKGERLKPTQSLMGYWFSFATFYPGIQIYPNDDKGANAGQVISGSNKWLVPFNEVRSGGVGKDGIPAVSSPEFNTATDVSFLKNWDLVVGVSNGVDIKAYPHHVLDWHEIVNDGMGQIDYALIYCPLTGTATAWDRVINGEKTTFGVSGLLYNTNIVPYDRATDSNWSQLFDAAVFGSLKGTKPKTYMALETRWDTWKKLYPGAKIMNFNTGHNRNYGNYPYGDYRTEASLIFPVKYQDTRLHAKERVHAVIKNGKAKVYRFDSFTGE